MVSNYLILLALGLALLLSAPLHAAWTSAADGTLLGKRMPTLPLLAQQASAGHGAAHHDAAAGASAGVVLIDFSTPACVTCREHVPLLNRLQMDYRKRGLTVVGMARAPPARPRAAAFVPRVPRDYLPGSDLEGTLFAQLGVDNLPAAVLVDRNGIVVWQGDPATLSRATIERTLAAPALGEWLRF